ncbi:COQ9 family protein [Altererythrobacter confluentis]|uniref:COQ9 family protein n=1 Tax=Allopontixanthobacter confluentis TaxID=1849021 RepID=A0A6L7GCP0_9SPHN|nr:COQ9 family protein [Allopontixanthobacter confluentis]MXP13236.1 COQ9 family protein [Allopontixanthobacter confluentis]
MADQPHSMADMTLDELRLTLAPMVASASIFDGWSDAAVRSAAQQGGVDADVALLAYPDGAMDMISAWIETIDLAMADALPASTMAAMPIRERIRSLVQFRLDAVAGLEEALRRALAIMAMPQNAPRALKTGWHSADVMWRLAGDVATDYNHYTKRTILAGIYGATLAVFVDDDSAGKSATRSFLDRRIDGVMKFEKAKAKWLNSDRETFSVIRFLGRLRYPAR